MTSVAMDRLDQPIPGQNARPPRMLRGWVLAAAALMLAASGLMWLADAISSGPLFPLRKVTLDGDLHHVTEAALREAMAPQVHGGLLSLDVAAIRDSITALPWVRNASVRRIWPHSLAVDIVEQKPLARWGDGALVNTAGDIFRPASIPDGLPELQGPDSRRADVVALFQALNGPLDERGLNIAALRLDRRGSWTVALNDGAVIEVGTHDVEGRLTRFLGALPRLRRQAGRALERVDLRYPNGFAIQWRKTADTREQNRNGKRQ